MNTKQELRAQGLGARRGLTAAQRAQKSEEIVRQLRENKDILASNTVFSYFADEDEVDLAAFHRWAMAQGKRLAFPVTEKGGHMEAYAPLTEKDVGVGRFGLRQPIMERSQAVAPEEIDVVLVPCVAFDRQGGRLGRGGGYYDRYLIRCPKAKAILVAFAEQEMPAVPRESHDAPIETVVKA